MVTKILIAFVLLLGIIANKDNKYFDYKDGYTIKAFPKFDKLPQSKHNSFFKWTPDEDIKMMKNIVSKHSSRYTK